MQSGSASTVGPIPPERSGDGQIAEVERRVEPGRRPDGHHLDRGVRSVVAVADPVLAGERCHRVDLQLVALTPVAAVERRRHDRPRAPLAVPARPARRARPSSPAWSSRPGQVRTRSCWRGAASNPTAESTPARGGTMTAGMPSASASAQAWRGPAPPKATSASSVGSTPRATDTARSACSMAASTTSITPAASVPAASQRLLGRGEVEPADAGQLGVGRDPARHQVRVGDGGLGAAVAVARRPGAGARASWPDGERSAGIEPGDGAAAGADRVHVEAGQADRESTDAPLTGRLRHAAADEADIGAGATHVEADGVRVAAGRRRSPTPPGHHPPVR